MGLPALGLGQPGRILTASAIYTLFDGSSSEAKSVLPALRRLRRGKPLPPELTRIAALADREAEELVSDRGGWEGMSGAEQLMVSNWKAARQAAVLNTRSRLLMVSLCITGKRPGRRSYSSGRS